MAVSSWSSVKQFVDDARPEDISTCGQVLTADITSCHDSVVDKADWTFANGVMPPAFVRSTSV